MVVLGGDAVSYERGTPVALSSGRAEVRQGFRIQGSKINVEGEAILRR